MARIRREPNLLDWAEIEELGDLERLKMVLEELPDEGLIDVLEEERKGRRDDYPVWMMWNTLIAGIIYGHPTIESLRRELLRNPSLRRICGISGIDGIEGVPTKDAYYRFFKKLVKHKDLVEEIIDKLIEKLRGELRDLGKDTAIDTTEIRTYARGKKEPEESADPEADWGVKRRWEKKKEGKLYEVIKRWFGYKLHMIVDANYEVPLKYKVTRGSRSDIGQAKEMVERLEKSQAWMKIEHLIGDKGYDDGKLIRDLWEREGKKGKNKIKCIIDMREMIREEDDGKVIEIKGIGGNIVSGKCGEVYCYDMGRENRRREMVYGGFERERGTHKYRCPAAYYDIECENEDRCSIKGSRYGRVVRIKMKEDWRKFPPVARNTYKWERLYKKRTAVERVNSRLKKMLGLGDLYIRGKKKIEVRIGLSLIVLLAMGLAQVKRKGKEFAWRSLVRAAG